MTPRPAGRKRTTLRDLLDKGYTPEALRYLLASVPYRKKLNFTWDGMKAAMTAIERLRNYELRLKTGHFLEGANEALAARAQQAVDEVHGHAQIVEQHGPDGIAVADQGDRFTSVARPQLIQEGDETALHLEQALIAGRSMTGWGCPSTRPQHTRRARLPWPHGPDGAAAVVGFDFRHHPALRRGSRR